MNRVKIQLPPYAKKYAPPYTRHNRFKCLYGGRGSSKTWTVARLLLLDAITRPIRVACGREHKSSINQSAKKALEVQIRLLGLSSFFHIGEEIIGANGSLFFFQGIAVKPDEMRGWEDVDHVWIEEAQFLTEAAAQVLVPTIRKKNSQLWFTWNPKFRHDWVWRRFILEARDEDVTTKVNYNDNPWFPAEAEQERLMCKKYNSEMYAHIWEGDPDDEGDVRKVLPFAMVQECLDGWKEHSSYIRSITASKAIPIYMGLDLADQGADYNALVVRQGPALISAEKWRAKIMGDTVRRAHSTALEYGAMCIYYDVGGVGSTARSYWADPAMGLNARRYRVRPENFGGAIKGKETRYSYRVSNEEFFARRNAQLAWTLRIRATWTRALLAGEKNIDKKMCLFINPDIHRIDEFASQLSQPIWKEGAFGKTEIEKHDDEEPSPDLYDAAILAFARDSLYGLKAR